RRHARRLARPAGAGSQLPHRRLGDGPDRWYRRLVRGRVDRIARCRRRPGAETERSDRFAVGRRRRHGGVAVRQAPFGWVIERLLQPRILALSLAYSSSEILPASCIAAARSSSVAAPPPATSRT